MIDAKILEILVCPKCKGGLSQAEGGHFLVCQGCHLKYPVREGVPVMLVEEALDVGGQKRPGQKLGAATDNAMATFRVVGGPNKGLSFHLEKLSCKAIGRAVTDPQKTAMFGVDVALALDEGTKGIVQHYLAGQFKDSKAKGQETGSFKRTSDVILDDVSISRLHAMVFFGEGGVGVLDLVSKNGTFVNGEEIESRLLRKGDAIEIGETKIVFEG